MLSRLDGGAGVFSNLLLCVVCLSSGLQTFQIHRGAGAGFLLQAVAPLVETAAPFTAPLGSDLDSGPLDSTWFSAVVGLPLLAFAFHWLNGDHSTANILLGGALLLAAGSDFSGGGKAVMAHSIAMVASITILILSIFTGNGYGIIGSLLVGAAGLLEGTDLQRLLMLRKRDVVRCLMAGANLTLQWALQRARRELDQGAVGLSAETSN
ncbi:transmembrane protein 276 [Eublepharis macularius]|uniref:Transmembrane protein 276 n=1 Tax=Eublepharis macularius TaxID=481883 RepID=A0AA97JRF1_EUBMA|nr:transmembrane protein 276 [Eublepharis macularius]